MGIFDIVSSAAKVTGRAMGRAEKRKKSMEDFEQWSRDSIQEEKDVEECYEVFVERCRSMYADIEESATIKAVLQEACTSNHINRDFSVFDKLPEQYRKSKAFKETLETIKNTTYEDCVDAYLNYDKSVYYTMLMLKPLLYFGEIKDEINYSLKHMEYFSNPYEDIKSVLTDYTDMEEAFEDIKNYYDEDIIEGGLFDKLVATHCAVSELYKAGKYQEAYNNITSAAFDSNIFDAAKKILLKFAMMGNDSSQVTQSYELTKEIVDGLFKATRLIHREGSEYKYDFVRIPVVDMIIAEAIRYNQTGMIEVVNDQLKEFLNNFILKKDEMDAEQFNVLQRVFAYLKAYEQEKIVLEFMVLNNIPRNDVQEKRLLFLRNANSMSSGVGNVNIPEEIYISDQDKFTYDYRCMSWGESQIKGYLNYFSGENKRMTVPMVIDDWNNNLELKGIKWSLSDLLGMLDNGLKGNFGDKYKLETVESGALSDGWIDYSESILIEEDENNGNRYPWLQFVISAEQLTLSQISFSIFVLYNPEKDFIGEEDCIKVNSVMANKLIALKLKQNPKLNEYIKVTKNVIISELEKYLNGATVTDDIY